MPNDSISPRSRTNIDELIRRGGQQGGNDPAPAGAPAPAPAAPAPAPAPAPVAAGGAPAPAPAAPPAAAAPALLEYYQSTIGTLTKTLEELKASGAAKEKDLKSATEALASFQKLEGDRAETLFKTLPEANQKKLEPFKAQVPQQVWINLLTAEAAVAGVGTPAPGGAPGGAPKPVPPPTGSPIGGPLPEEYALSERSREILEQFPNSERLMKRAKSIKAEPIPNVDGTPSGALKFAHSVRTMLQNITMGSRVEMKKENAPQAR